MCVWNVVPRSRRELSSEPVAQSDRRLCGMHVFHVRAMCAIPTCQADYEGMDATKAMDDFLQRVRRYEQAGCSVMHHVPHLRLLVVSPFC